ncbi:uncharacterized protein LOC144762811 [Lissotriton helveticus]
MVTDSRNNYSLQVRPKNQMKVQPKQMKRMVPAKLMKKLDSTFQRKPEDIVLVWVQETILALSFEIWTKALLSGAKLENQRLPYRTTSARHPRLMDRTIGINADETPSANLEIQYNIYDGQLLIAKINVVLV